MPGLVEPGSHAILERDKNVKCKMFTGDQKSSHGAFSSSDQKWHEDICNNERLLSTKLGIKHPSVKVHVYEGDIKGIYILIVKLENAFLTVTVRKFQSNLARSTFG